MNRNNIIFEIKILNQKRLDKRRKSSDRVLFTIQMENLILKYNIKPFEINLIESKINHGFIKVYHGTNINFIKPKNGI